jgi:hypothetical protein
MRRARRQFSPLDVNVACDDFSDAWTKQQLKAYTTSAALHVQHAASREFARDGGGVELASWVHQPARQAREKLRIVGGVPLQRWSLNRRLSRVELARRFELR